MADFREICEQYSSNRLIQWRNLTQNRLSIIRSNFGLNEDEVIAFYDSSAFENSKVGLVICDSGIYYRNSFQSPYYLTWKQVRSLKFTYSSNNLHFGDNSVFVFPNDIDTIAQMIANIRINAKIDNFVEKTTGILGFLESAANWLSELDTSSNNPQNDTLAIADISKDTNNTKVVETSQVIQQNNVSTWSIGYKGNTYGPFSAEDAKMWIEKNYNGSDKLFGFKQGMQNWEMMSNIPEFSEFLNSINILPPLPEF